VSSDPIRDNTVDPRTSLKQRHLDEIGHNSPPEPAKTSSTSQTSTNTPPAPGATATEAADKLAQIPVARLPAGTTVESNATQLDRDTY
jgi:hypothetical protein